MNEEVRTELRIFRQICKNLEIPEYCENLTDNEILLLALYKLGEFVVENDDIIKADIREGE